VTRSRSEDAGAEIPTSKTNLHFEMAETEDNDFARLKAVFEKHGGSLTEAEFKKEFQGDSKNAALFKQIDHNCDGSVDWTEYTEFMLLQDREKLRMQANEERWRYAQTCIPRPADLNVQHSKSITKVKLIKELSFHATCSEDSTVRFWHAASGRFSRVLRVPARNRGTQPPHVYDVVYMSASRKFAVASADRTITIFDGIGFEICGRIRPVIGMPLHLDYFCTNETEILVCGDGCGNIHVWHLEPNAWAFADADANLDLRGQVSEGVQQYFRRKFHQSSITNLHIDGANGCVISSDSDGCVHFSDLDQGRLHRSFLEHKRSVHSFVLIPDRKIVASAGAEKRICFWNILSCTLSHEISGSEHFESPISSLAGNDDARQLISMTFEGIIKIWELQSFTCTQTIRCKEQKLQTMMFDDINRKLIVCNRTMNVRIARAPMHKKKSTHQSLTVAVKFNQEFETMVSASRRDVQVWELYKGMLLFRFDNPAGDYTSVCFDSSGRKLFTGGIDGILRLWNFNNGELLQEDVRSSNSEMSTITCFKETLEGTERAFVVSAGWDRSICLSQQNGDEKIMMPLQDQVDRAHEDEIRCIIHCGDGTIVSGGDDGRLCFWSTTSGAMKFRVGNSPAAARLLDKQAYLRHLSTVARRTLLQFLNQEECTEEDMFDQFHHATQDEESIEKKRNLVRQNSALAFEANEDDDHREHQLKKYLLSRRASEITGKRFEFEKASLQEHVEREANWRRMKGVPKPDRLAVEALLFVQRLRTLVSAGADGYLRFWSPETGKLVFKIDAGHSAEESILSLQTDGSWGEKNLFSADSAGYIKVWDLSQLSKPSMLSNSEFKVKFLREWQVENQRAVSCMEFVRWTTEVRKPINLLVIAAEFDVFLYTLRGHFVGKFGDGMWNLNTMLTWLTRKNMIVNKAKNFHGVIQTLNEKKIRIRKQQDDWRSRQEELERLEHQKEIDNYRILFSRTRQKHRLDFLSEIESKLDFTSSTCKRRRPAKSSSTPCITTGMHMIKLEPVLDLEQSRQLRNLRRSTNE